MAGLRLCGVQPRVLAPVDLVLAAGELVFVSGPSGSGERQRLALVRLLAQGPEALLLDEATANLDPFNRDQVETLVGAFRERQAAAVLWVSHDPEQRGRLGGRQFAIRAGRLEPDAAADDPPRGRP